MTFHDLFEVVKPMLIGAVGYGVVIAALIWIAAQANKGQ